MVLGFWYQVIAEKKMECFLTRYPSGGITTKKNHAKHNSNELKRFSNDAEETLTRCQSSGPFKMNQNQEIMMAKGLFRAEPVDRNQQSKAKHDGKGSLKRRNLFTGTRKS